MIFVCLCMLCFHVCTHICFHLISNVHIVRTFDNRTVQTFEKQHNLGYRYVSYIKSETCDIWRTGAWFLKPFGERVEENQIYHLVKPNSTVKTRTVYGGCTVCYQVFLEMEKLTFRAKFEPLTHIVTPKLFFSLNLHQNIEQKSY